MFDHLLLLRQLEDRDLMLLTGACISQWMIDHPGTA